MLDIKRAKRMIYNLQASLIKQDKKLESNKARLKSSHSEAESDAILISCVRYFCQSILCKHQIFSKPGSKFNSFCKKFLMYLQELERKVR